MASAHGSAHVSEVEADVRSGPYRLQINLMHARGRRLGRGTRGNDRDQSALPLTLTFPNHMSRQRVTFSCADSTFGDTATSAPKSALESSARTLTVPNTSSASR